MPVQDQPTIEQMNSILLSGLEQMKTMESDTVSIIMIDKKVRNINGFLCIGTTGYHKESKEYGTGITGFHYSDNDHTELIFSSPGNDLDKEYSKLADFLQNFRCYSAKEIKKEETLIKNKYTVMVTPATTVMADFKSQPKTYIGIVSTKQPLEHTIAEVRLETSVGEQLFSPGNEGKVPIICNDSKKGTVTKKGTLILLNSFGKKIKLPFRFTYHNNGPLK